MATKTKLIIQQVVSLDSNPVLASKYPRYTILLANSISSITAAELDKSIQAAANSAASALSSKNAAKVSETNSKASETAAKTSQDAAKASQDAAKTSETNAKASETAAKSSQTSAASSASAASQSASAASSSASAASGSASAASQSATTASQQAGIATTKATEASSSASAASTSAQQAANSANAAGGSATAASNSANAAKTSETNAKASETAAANSVNDVINAIANSSAPLPDVWVPFNNNLIMFTGYGDEVKVGGITVANLVSFSRATTATYVDKSGNLQTAGIDEPRFEHEGVLLENASTNLCERSNDITDYWANNGNPTTEKLSNGFTKITPDRPFSGKYFIPTTKLVVGSVYTVSFWAYTDADPKTTAFILGMEKEGSGGGLVRVLTNEPKHYELTFTAVQQIPSIVLYNETGTGVFYIKNVQLEQAANASSYIPTSGTQVTRAVDKCSIQCLHNLLELQNEYTVSVTFDRKTPDFRIYEIGEGNAILGSGNNIYFRNNGVDYRCDIDLTKPTTISISVKDKTSKVVCVNGTIVKGNYINQNIPPSGTNLLVFGNTRMFTNRAPTGHIRDFKIWHKALTEEQLKALK